MTDSVIAAEPENIHVGSAQHSCGQFRNCLLIIFVLLMLPSSSFAAEFPELQWLHVSADPLEHLSSSPAECLNLSGKPEQVFLIEAGRQAFRSPFLLGGQASRVGLSCQGCHINGHGHPDFYIGGISGAAGTVDVTTSVFSEVRGDQIHNPVPIPDLIDISHKQSFGTVAPMDSLSGFVEALIVEEFAGQAPSPILLKSLVTYLQALSSSSCPAILSSSHKLIQQLNNIMRSVIVINQAYEKAELNLADFLIMSAQYELSILYQRFAIEATVEAGQNIISMSRQLGELRNELSNPSQNNFLDDLQNWVENWQKFALELQIQETKSLYQDEVLEAWLQESFSP